MQPPTILCSTVADGSMKARTDDHMDDVTHNREVFLTAHDIAIADTTLVRLVYEGTDYCRYATVSEASKGDGTVHHSTMTADAMVVTQPGHALFLPLADCVGAVLYDPTKGILMLSHLGRHNLEQFGATKSVGFLVNEHGVDPKNLTVWLSPAASKVFYPVYAFNNRSLHNVTAEQLLAAGVTHDKIETSPIDSAADPNYYSHSQFLKGNRPDDGRFAVVAMMTN
jgi:copper oxidase (laccase) domain-containing protein